MGTCISWQLNNKYRIQNKKIASHITTALHSTYISSTHLTTLLYIPQKNLWTSKNCIPRPRVLGHPFVHSIWTGFLIYSCHSLSWTRLCSGYTVWDVLQSTSAISKLPLWRLQNYGVSYPQYRRNLPARLWSSITVCWLYQTLSRRLIHSSFLITLSIGISSIILTMLYLWTCRR